MTTDEIIEALTKMNELMLLEEAKQEKRIEDAVLIMHPKHKDLMAASGLNTFIVWSYMCDEDKAYIITDECWADEIKRNYMRW